MSLVSDHLNHPAAIPYAYQALGQHEIRLLTLAPGEESDEIHIRLEHVDLQNNPQVEYEALSYAWGTSKPNQRVIVDAEDGSSQAIAVRDNLADALRRIRDTTSTKILWVDALCMNQEDNVEKSHQVPFMTRIYRDANRVIVWLGSEHDDSASAMEMLRYLGGHIELSLTTVDIRRPVSFDKLWQTLQNSTSLQTSIHGLLERDWFRRLWVHQEVYLARRSVVLCGSSEAEWSAFITAALFVVSVYQTPNLTTLYNLSFLRPINWFDLRVVTGSKECTDPRDRIYGMFAMLADDAIDQLKVDYSLSVPQVYTAATKHYIQTSKTLTLFHSCELTRDRMENLPSWVPDWSTETRAGHLAIEAVATSANRPFFNFPGTRTLRLAGMMAPKVEYVEPLGETRDKATDAILRFVHTDRMEAKYADGNLSFKHALVCAITGGEYSCTRIYPRSDLQAEKEERRRDLRRLLSSEADTALGRVLGAAYLVHEMDGQYAAWRERALFRTEDGYIGLSHQEVHKGDRLFFPLGSTWPLLIRPNAGPPRNEWSLVSVCYVSGLMAGEILYGPVPPIYTLARKIGSEGMETRSHFHRVRSDSEISSKPDLEFEKERMKKAFGVEDEKLLTPDLLRSKGVPVEWIDLV